MKLIDARRLVIRDQVSLRFAVEGGRECVVDRHGIVRLPGITTAPEFRVEEEFSKAPEFHIERPGVPPRRLSRAELEKLTQAGAAEHAQSSADHDE
jgi:hypothetical protein